MFATESDKGAAIIAPAVLVGLSGGIWSCIPIELIEIAGYKSFGQNWGTVLLFGLLGFLLFSLTSNLTGENGLIDGIIFAVVAIIGVVFAFLGWRDDKQEKEKKPAAPIRK